MRKISLLLITIIFYTSCVTSGGGNWWIVDFDKYDKNYRDIGDFSSQITIDMTESEITGMFGKYLQLAEMTKHYKTLTIDQWEAAMGKDYITKVLYIKIVNNHVDQFIVKDIPNHQTVVPIFIWH